MKIHKNVKFDEVEEQIAETLKHAPAQKDGLKSSCGSGNIEH
jgi:hypothetical protein